MDKQLGKASLISQTETLQPHPQQHRSTQRVPLVITYHPALSRTSRTLRKHLNVLHISDRLKAAIPDPPIVAFRRPHNLRDLLVRAKLKRTNTPTQTGNGPCNSTRCKTCHIMMREESFISRSPGTKHRTRFSFTCKTRNLIYLIQCIRETANPLHIRMNGHRSDINTRKTDKPVAAHFNLPDHLLDDLQVMGIGKIHTNNAGWKKHRERYWIFTLETMAPTGMNLDD